MLAWLTVWGEVQTCIWPSWYHCHSLSLAAVKSRLVLPFWYQHTWVVLDKWPLNRCVCVCVHACVRARMRVCVFQLDHQQCKGLICPSVHCSQLTPNHLAATHQYVVLVPTYMEQTYDCDLQLSPFGIPVSLPCLAGCKQQQCEMLTSRWTAQCHKLSLPWPEVGQLPRISV